MVSTHRTLYDFVQHLLTTVWLEKGFDMDIGFLGL